ncbi:hypothetical protein ACOMHN_041697 [Nucella lapillus]
MEKDLPCEHRGEGEGGLTGTPPLGLGLNAALTRVRCTRHRTQRVFYKGNSATCVPHPVLVVHDVCAGDDNADQVLLVLLGTPMFVGGLVGAALDNLAPGTPEERGIKQWQQSVSTDQDNDSSQHSAQAIEEAQKEVAATYDLPFVSGLLRRVGCCSYVPFLPSFQGFWGRKSNPAENAEEEEVVVKNGFGKGREKHSYESDVLL